MARVRLWKFPSFLIVLASVVEKNFLLPDVSIHRSRSNLSLSFFLLLCWPADRETTHLARVSCIRLASRWMRPTNLLSLFLSSFYLKDSGQLSSTSGWRAAELVRRPVCWVAVVRRELVWRADLHAHAPALANNRKKKELLAGSMRYCLRLLLFFDSRHYELRHSWLGLGHYGRRIPVGAHCVSLSMWWRDSLDIVFWSCPIDLRVDGTTRATTRCHFTRIIISRFSPRRLLSGKSTLSIQCVCVFFVNHDNGDLEAIFSPFC